MALVDSRTGKGRKAYSIAELEEAARLMRAYDLVALHAAGSGHAGGTLSVMDITAALYLSVADHDPSDPAWAGRDRVFWSVGHKAPSLYLGLGMAGYFPVEDVVLLRKFGSAFQGHPHWLKLPGVEISSGSLGQGLSVAVGSALAARLDGRKNKVFCIHGDGELQEGEIWEAAMSASHHRLDNLIAVVDKNSLQIDGSTGEVMDLEPLADKWRSFGWSVLEIDGHDMAAIVAAFGQARMATGKPTAIIATTMKGKGVDFMEDRASWHGRVPSREELDLALGQLGLPEPLPVERLLQRARDFQVQASAAIEAGVPAFAKDRFWNHETAMRATMEPTRMGFGKALRETGSDERVVCLGLDISSSIQIDQFYVKNPERKARFLSMGIAEQNGTAVAAGLAREGKLPVIGSYGVFSSGRALDQIRTTIAYSQVNVLIAGAHGGISVGPDGATHQALEEIATIAAIPNMVLEVPCDAVETDKATRELLFKVPLPKYLRFAREATPVVTGPDTPYVFGKANVIRYRGSRAEFKDAFEHILAESYTDEGEALTIVSCGPETTEAMRAAYILKEEYGIEARVLHIHTLKPIDREAILAAALETGHVLTCEEHQVGGFGNLVSKAIFTSPRAWDRKIRFDMLGVEDRFGESGQSWELMKAFGLTAEFIALRAKGML